MLTYSYRSFMASASYRSYALYSTVNLINAIGNGWVENV